MADNDSFLTDRLDGTVDDGNDLASQWPNFEAAIRNCFGIPADTAMSAAFSIGTGPNITMIGGLTLAGAPTTDLMAATKAYMESVGNPYLGVSRCRAYLTSNITYSVDHYVSWDNADINENSMWSASNPSRITIPTAAGGNYLCGVTFSCEKSVGTAAAFWLAVKKNRSSTYQWPITFFDQTKTSGRAGVSGMFMACNLTSGDYLELDFDRYDHTQGTIYSADTTMWACQIGPQVAP